MAKFAKRHYEAIADVLQDLAFVDDPRATLFTRMEVERITDRLIVAFDRDNPRFDRERFRVRVLGED